MNSMRDPFAVVLLVVDRAPQGQFLSGPSEGSEEERHRSVYAQATVSSTSRSTSTNNLFRNRLQLAFTRACGSVTCARNLRLMLNSQSRNVDVVKSSPRNHFS